MLQWRPLCVTVLLLKAGSSGICGTQNWLETHGSREWYFKQKVWIGDGSLETTSILFIYTNWIIFMSFKYLNSSVLQYFLGAENNILRALGISQKRSRCHSNTVHTKCFVCLKLFHLQQQINYRENIKAIQRKISTSKICFKMLLVSGFISLRGCTVWTVAGTLRWPRLDHVYQFIQLGEINNYCIN